MRFSVSRTRPRGAARRRLIGVAAMAAVATPLMLTTSAVAAPDPSPSPKVKRQMAALQRANLLEGAKEHLANFQKIADNNGGTRVATSPGYQASVEYVRDRMEDAGYEVSVREFPFPFFRETAPPEMEQITPDQTVYEPGADFLTMTYSAPGEVQAPVQAVDIQIPPPADPGSTSGCEESDFADFTPGNIALIQRGSCTFRQKALNAQAAGASAVIIFNEGQETRTDAFGGTLSDIGVEVPTVGASFAVGKDLADPAGTVVRLQVTAILENRTSKNVIAETRSGNPNNVIVLGGHLDSVAAGAGINDNGSGSAAILEVAEQLARFNIHTRNKIRFAWWGSEEFGLWGSIRYVESLSQEQVEDIGMYLNFDMVGSPNFVRFIYDGDNSDGKNMQVAPEGSERIERFFQTFFRIQDLPSKGTPLNGRSDYQAFAAAGIPVGGLFTGAEGVKTEEEAEKYGGQAGVPYDPCYHQACDDLSNISDTALRQNTQAIAASALFFGFFDTARMKRWGNPTAAPMAALSQSAGGGRRGHLPVR